MGAGNGIHTAIDQPDGNALLFQCPYPAWPVVAALLIMLILMWPYLRSEDLRFRLSFAALTANQNADPSMVNPRYLGIDEENQAYSITADLARKLRRYINAYSKHAKPFRWKYSQPSRRIRHGKTISATVH